MTIVDGERYLEIDITNLKSKANERKDDPECDNDKI
jgi:hypothetical protein